MTSHLYQTSITIVVPPCPGVNPEIKHSHLENLDTKFLESVSPVCYLLTAGKQWLYHILSS